jgi:hypothetical protein
VWLAYLDLSALHRLVTAIALTSLLDVVKLKMRSTTGCIVDASCLRSRSSSSIAAISVAQSEGVNATLADYRRFVRLQKRFAEHSFRLSVLRPLEVGLSSFDQLRPLINSRRMSAIAQARCR